MELGVVPINLLPSPPGGAKDLLEPPLSALYLMPIWCIGQNQADIYPIVPGCEKTVASA